MIHSDDDEVVSAHIAIPTNRPRHLVTANDAILALIKVAKLIMFRIDTPPQQAPMVTVVLADPTNLDDLKTFKGQGPTIGHAFREMLDHVNVEFRIEEEDGN